MAKKSPPTPASTLSLDKQTSDKLLEFGIKMDAAGQLQEAKDAYNEILVIDPFHHIARNNLAVLFKKCGDLEKAEQSYRQAIIIKPDYAGAFYNLGILMKVNSLLDEAINCYIRSLRINPMDGVTRGNLGLCFQEKRRLDLAEQCIREAISLNPESTTAHYNLGLVLLAQGDFSEGWRKYEWRYRTDVLKKYFPHFDVPQWQGEQGNGRTILIYAEQGFGDSLQFCRLIPLVAARGWRVFLEVPEPLARLARTLVGVDLVLTYDAARPDFDVHCPMLSLPMALAITLSDIPANIPYFYPDPKATARWKKNLDQKYGTNLRVGIVWAGNPRPEYPELQAIDRRRSIPLELLAPLFENKNVHFFSLQKSSPEKKSPLPPFSKGGEPYESPGGDFVSASSPSFEKGGTQISPPFGKGGRGGFIATNLIDLMDKMHDFYDTAALVANLDIIISVDTAMAHLAGALGKTVWLLDRFDSCWRWLHDRYDSPWYPTLRIFRQNKPGNWSEIVDLVNSELHKTAMVFSPDLIQPYFSFSEAAISHISGDNDRSKAIARQILVKNPSHHASLNLLGIISCLENEKYAGSRLISWAITAKPHEHLYYSNLYFEVLLEFGWARKAVDAAVQSIMEFPYSIDFHCNLAKILDRCGIPKDTETSCLRSVIIAPNNAAAFNNLGHFLKKHFYHVKAIDCYVKSLRINPVSEEAYTELGTCLLENGQFDAARGCLYGALSINPGYARARLCLGLLFLRERHTDQPDDAPHNIFIRF